MSTQAAEPRISYAKARAILLVLGLLILIGIGAVMFVRSVQTVEVIGVLLFIIVFIGLVFWGLPGGLIGAGIAILSYVGIRYQGIQTFGWGELSGFILTRSLSYLVFGAIGGWANQQLESSLQKLELYDQIDDETGLFNARFFLQDTDLEMSRSLRYQTIFSIAIVEIEVDALEALSRRQRAGVLKELGRQLRDSVRTVDRAFHGRDRNTHRLGVVLPETARQGAEIFTSRLASSIREYLSAKGIDVPKELPHRALSFPDDESDIVAVREGFEAIDRAEHPDE